MTLDELKERLVEALSPAERTYHTITPERAVGSLWLILEPYLSELAAWRDECDKVGVPYDPEGLVRHHRGNAGLAAGMDRLSDILEARNALAAFRDEVSAPSGGIVGAWWESMGEPLLTRLEANHGRR